jgi:hypothetical protein
MVRWQEAWARWHVDWVTLSASHPPELAGTPTTSVPHFLCRADKGPEGEVCNRQQGEQQAKAILGDAYMVRQNPVQSPGKGQRPWHAVPILAHGSWGLGTVPSL